MLRRVRSADEGAAGRLRDRALDRADGDLVAVVDGSLQQAARRAGSRLACKPGCSECCIGPFPITRLDVRRLRQGLEALRQRDPQRAAAIETRAREAVRVLGEAFPGDAASGRLGGDRAAEDRFLERFEAVPCPVLDPATQTCELYASRPITCRTYGPPVTFGGENLPPCRLCFQGSPATEVEACRVEPDPDGLEGIILERLRREDGDDRDTIIAFAILPRDE
jgi:Fe-S-cluster containining protein